MAQDQDQDQDLFGFGGYAEEDKVVEAFKIKPKTLRQADLFDLVMIERERVTERNEHEV